MTAKLYYGSIAHSRSLTELEVVEKALMLVDEQGIIGWVHRDVPSASSLQEVAAEHGLDITRDPVEVVELDEDEFLCPGLIDTHTVSTNIVNIVLMLTSRIARAAVYQYRLGQWRALAKLAGSVDVPRGEQIRRRRVCQRGLQ